MALRRHSRRTGRRLLVAAIVIVLVGAAGVPALNFLRYSPGQTVLRYFHALEHGDSAAALSLLRAPEAAGGGISDAILDDAAALPSRAKVESVSDSDGGGSKVHVSFTLGTQVRSLDLNVVPGPATWGMFRSWAIDVPAWPTLDLSGSTAVTLGGQDVPGGVDKLPVLFPVSYTVGANAKYLNSTPVRAQALQPGKGVPVALDGKPTGALVTKVQKQMRSQLDKCTTQRVLMPSGCLIGYQTTAQVLGKVRWKVKSYPEVSIRADSDGLTMRPATGVFTVSGRYRDAVTAHESSFSEDVKTTITGTVALDGDSVKFTQPSTTDGLGTVK